MEDASTAPAPAPAVRPVVSVSQKEDFALPAFEPTSPPTLVAPVARTGPVAKDCVIVLPALFKPTSPPTADDPEPTITAPVAADCVIELFATLLRPTSPPT